MLGLRRNAVELVEHDPGWAALAGAACREVRNCCGELLVDVQHVGSTAVHGMPAKPILDLAAAVVTLDSLKDLKQRLAGAGFVYHSDHAAAGGHLFVVDSAPGVRTIHLHVVEHGDKQWNDYIRFRDLLRSRASLRRDYASLKRDLARRHTGDREAYTAGKAAFVRRTLEMRPAG